MRTSEIILVIKSYQAEHVVIDWTGQNVEKDEQWALAITNEPSIFFQNMDNRNRGRAVKGFEFKLNSVEEGIKHGRELFQHAKLEPTPMPVSPNLDSLKPLYLAVHIARY